MTQVSNHLDHSILTDDIDYLLRSFLPNVININYLGQGTCNHHWQIDTESQSYIWRQFGPTPPGASRNNERQVLKQLQHFDWVPKLVLDRPEGLLFHAVTPRDTKISALKQEQRQQLIDSILTLWQQPIAVAAMDYSVLIHHYAQLAATYPEDKLKYLLDNLSHWKTEDFCLIHQDIHAENLVITDQGILLIDWEYTTFGNPWIDAVALDRMLKLSPTEKQQLESYLPNFKNHNKKNDHWSEMHRWLEALDQLWYAAQSSQIVVE